MAEIIMRKLVNDLNLNDQWIIDSAGTAAYHTGESPDERTIECCKKHFKKEYPVYDYRARQFTSKDFEKFDFV
jgi:protein-tyrosine-phosphatase